MQEEGSPVIKLADFGFSKMMDAEQYQYSIACGTPTHLPFNVETLVHRNTNWKELHAFATCVSLVEVLALKLGLSFQLARGVFRTQLGAQALDSIAQAIPRIAPLIDIIRPILQLKTPSSCTKMVSAVCHIYTNSSSKVMPMSCKWT